MQTSPPRRTPLIASIAVIVVLGAALGYFYVSSTGTINSLNSSVSSQSGVIAALQSTVTAQSSTISKLQANVTAYGQLVATLRQVVATDTANIASLNSTVASDTAQIASLDQQIATANAMISNLTSAVNLQDSSVLVSAKPVVIYGTTHASSVPFETFSPKYAGYVLVQVSSATQPYFLNATAYPSGSNSGAGVWEYLTFLAPTSSTTIEYFIMPVTIGTETSFALMTTTVTDGTATVTATYYY